MSSGSLPGIKLVFYHRRSSTLRGLHMSALDMISFPPMRSEADLTPYVPAQSAPLAAWMRIGVLAAAEPEDDSRPRPLGGAGGAGRAAGRPSGWRKRRRRASPGLGAYVPRSGRAIPPRRRCPIPPVIARHSPRARPAFGARQTPHRRGSYAGAHRHRGWWCGERERGRIAPRAPLAPRAGPARCPGPRLG